MTHFAPKRLAEADEEETAAKEKAEPVLGLTGVPTGVPPRGVPARDSVRDSLDSRMEMIR